MRLPKSSIFSSIDSIWDILVHMIIIMIGRSLNVFVVHSHRPIIELQRLIGIGVKLSSANPVSETDLCIEKAMVV
jgi:hypothetical protein